MSSRTASTIGRCEGNRDHFFTAVEQQKKVGVGADDVAG
jgi:hypothetical protein